MKKYLEILEDHKTLQTDRLILRPMTLDDAEDMFEYASDARTVKYLLFDPHESIDVSSMVITNNFLGKAGMYGIVLKETDKVIGTIDIRPDDENQKASFGYVINKKYWNKGYMTEALNCILNVCFDILKVHRVESTHYDGNVASGKVMQKCGMKYEGTAVDELIIKGEFVTVLHYAILKNEWEMVKNK